jgi:hypothetical protein
MNAPDAPAIKQRREIAQENRDRPENRDRNWKSEFRIARAVMRARRRRLEHSDDGNKEKNSYKEKHNDLRADLLQVRRGGRALSSQSACRLVIDAGMETMKRQSNERLGETTAGPDSG